MIACRMLTAMGVAAVLSLIALPAGAAQAKTTAKKGGATPTAATLPSDAPKDATGQCKDGTYTTAKTKQGACSSHGGIKTFATAQCKDDTYSFAKSTRGACSAHGGVKSPM
jgi:uncharacterized protein DUF3761